MAEIYKVDKAARKFLFEGVQGENEARSIQFDITPWTTELGNGAVTATAKRPTDAAPYPVAVTRDGNTVTWKPTSTDTAIDGTGMFQLEYTVDSVLAKTCIWSTMVAPSLDPAGDPPDPYDNWLAEMRQVAADALQSEQNAEDSAEDAEAWAVGQRGGVDVPSTDPTYHNNSKYWAEQSQANQYSAYIVKSASGDIASFADGADDVPMKSLKVAIVPKQAGSGDPSPSNVRPITGWTAVNVIVSPTTTASDGTTTPVPLGQTVYGGEFDVASGEGVSNVYHYSFTGQEACARIDAHIFRWTMPKARNGFSEFMCNMYKPLNVQSLAQLTDKSIAMTPGSTYLYMRNDDVDTVADMKAVLQGYAQTTPLSVLYAETGETSITFDPVSVPSLLGQNNVWSDAGAVSVEYRADPTLAYNELANVIVSLGGNI